MALDFKLKDVMHRITAKFYPATLPTAEKPYNLRAVYQPELDIHGIASKAEVYNIETSPKVIEEGMTAGMELIHYLAADGYKIKTPIFNLKISIPGEYEGTETHIPEGIVPQGRLTLSAGMRQYLHDNVGIQIDGVEPTNGFIANVYDQMTDETDTVLTHNGIFVINGAGLKIASDDLHANEVGIFFEDADGNRTKCDPRNVSGNTPHQLKAIAAQVSTGVQYHIVVCTQSSTKGSGTLLKNVREMKTDFMLAAS